MNAESLHPVDLPYNGAMLRWAREWRGRTIEEAAEKLKIEPDQIRAWEDEREKPKVREARNLAEFYGRQFLEFFYETEPTIVQSNLIPDYRVHRGAPDPSENREILEVQHWAEAQRMNALDLYEEIGEEPTPFPESLRATTSDDVEKVAERARDTFRFSIEQQKGLKVAEVPTIPSILRSKMEDLGILVLKENALAHYHVSGFTIAQFPLPLIVYTAEAPGRQAFTLMHEFAHILLRETAISGPEKVRVGDTHERKVERWCDRFAAAFLMPRAALVELRGEPTGRQPSIVDAALYELAKAFRVSAHAMLIRLVQLGYVDQDYYWSVKAPQFRAEEDRWEGHGRSAYWGQRIVNKLGNAYTGLVLEAWGTGRIPFHTAADYMGLKNPSHLPIIRQEFGGA